MPDVFSKTKRSEVMSRIRGHGNKETELALIQLMRTHKIKGWRRGSTILGKPDFVFPALRVAVFVDGCFWHGCPRCYRRPATNRKFWDTKIARNKERDKLVTRTLRKSDWNVLRIREHALRKPLQVIDRINKILDAHCRNQR